MSDILSTGLSVASGGLFGILGNGIGRLAGYFERKQAFKHEIVMMEFKEKQGERELVIQERNHAHEIGLMKMNLEAQTAETEAELSMMHAKGSWEGLKASYEHDTKAGKASQWVVDMLRCVRPVLTLVLWLLVLILTLKGSPIDIINSAIFAATAATLWWFGDRSRNGEVLHMEAMKK